MLVSEDVVEILRRSAVGAGWPSRCTVRVEFADFNPSPKEPPMTKSSMPLSELLEKHDDGDFLRAVAEAVLQLLMETDVEGVIGAGRRERSDGRTTDRNGYRDRALDTRLGTLNLRVPKLRQGLTSPASWSRAGRPRRRWRRWSRRRMCKASPRATWTRWSRQWA